MQGLLELAGLPYVGAGVLGSAVGMDKDVQKRLLRDAGVAGRALSRRSSAGSGERIPGAWPTSRDRTRATRYSSSPTRSARRSGSARSRRASALGAALEDAFHYDRKVADRGGLRGPRARMCGARQSIAPRRRFPARSFVTGRHEFYSYESKYVDPAGAEVKIPAALTALAERASARARVRRVSSALGLRGMARVDFLARRGAQRNLRQRGQHDSRLYCDQHVSQTVGGLGSAACAAHRSPDRARARGASRARGAQDNLRGQRAMTPARPKISSPAR